MDGINCIAVMKALSELSRMRILRVLMKEPLDVNAIAERVAISQYNVSKHLRVLREAGLLEVEKRGKQHFYGIATGLKARLASNENILQLDCCTFHFDKLPK